MRCMSGCRGEVKRRSRQRWDQGAKGVRLLPAHGAQGVGAKYLGALTSTSAGTTRQKVNTGAGVNMSVDQCPGDAKICQVARWFTTMLGKYTRRCWAKDRRPWVDVVIKH